MFKPAYSVSPPQPYSSANRAMDIGDYEGDGDQDVVVANQTATSCSGMSAVRSLRASRLPIHEANLGQFLDSTMRLKVSQLTLRDLDGDGEAELLPRVGSVFSSTGVVAMHTRDPSGALEPAKRLFVGTEFYYPSSNPVFYDENGDGLEHIALVGDGNGVTIVHQRPASAP